MLIDLFAQPDAMKLHLNELVSTYGPQTLVNLVNQKGHEQPVKELFERYVAQVRISHLLY